MILSNYYFVNSTNHLSLVPGPLKTVSYDVHGHFPPILFFNHDQTNHTFTKNGKCVHECYYENATCVIKPHVVEQDKPYILK